MRVKGSGGRWTGLGSHWLSLTLNIINILEPLAHQLEIASVCQVNVSNIYEQNRLDVYGRSPLLSTYEEIFLTRGRIRYVFFIRKGFIPVSPHSRSVRGLWVGLSFYFRLFHTHCRCCFLIVFRKIVIANIFWIGSCLIWALFPY